MTQTNTEERAREMTWEEFKEANPPKPYEQSEKWGDYTQRVSDHYNDLFVLYNKISTSLTR